MRFIRTRLLQLMTDATIVFIAFALAYVFRFEGQPPQGYIKQFLIVVPYLILLRVGLMALGGVYKLVWRFIGLRDLPRILLSLLIGSAFLTAMRFLLHPLLLSLGIQFNPLYATLPYGILAMELVLTTVGIISVRTIWRFTKEITKRHHQPIRSKRKALLAGAGSAGVMVVKETQTNAEVGFEVMGFLDDNPDLHGKVIQGYKVLGAMEDMNKLAASVGADMVVVTMADAPSSTIRRIVSLSEEAGLHTQIIPGLYEILSGRVNISKIRDVAIEDLLGRESVHLDETTIEAFLSNKAVLVSGAGGSIGSEICRQLSRYRPRKLILMDQAENPLFHIHRELLAHFPDVPLVLAVANVTHRDRIQQLMDLHGPDVVFHAAAHKHVPLMEMNPSEAIRNNVLGSKNMAEMAEASGVEAFVMISTDKAVNPTSVMGASKRLAEMYIQSMASRSKTRFLTVRFGNVLDSEGSVIPIFKQQIENGGPVTVTHPDMIRYFMTIPEASQLVLQAATMGEGGEIFILEMGEPIKILTLARDLIRLSGFRPDEDIKIEFSGIRPGEKLYEEINLTEENATKTKHPRIWIGKSRSPEIHHLQKIIDDLSSLLGSGTAPDVFRERLTVHISEYHPDSTKKHPGEDVAARADRAATALVPEGQATDRA